MMARGRALSMPSDGQKPTVVGPNNCCQAKCARWPNRLQLQAPAITGLLLFLAWLTEHGPVSNPDTSLGEPMIGFMMGCTEIAKADKQLTCGTISCFKLKMRTVPTSQSAASQPTSRSASIAYPVFQRCVWLFLQVHHMLLPQLGQGDWLRCVGTSRSVSPFLQAF